MPYFLRGERLSEFLSTTPFDRRDEGLPFRRIIEQLGQRQDDGGDRGVPDALPRMARQVQAAAHSMRPIWLLPLQAGEEFAGALSFSVTSRFRCVRY